MKNLKRLTRPQILKMKDLDLSFAVAQLMDWELKQVGEEFIAPDYVNDLNATFDVVKHLTTKGQVVVLEFPSGELDHYTMKRFAFLDNEWVWDSVEGKTPQEVILKTVLLANIPEKRQKLSIRRAKE